MLTLLLLNACKLYITEDEFRTRVDGDLDGVFVDQDCDDDDPDYSDGGAVWYVDADSDGVGGDDFDVACKPPSENHLAVTGDCNDDDPLLQDVALYYVDSDGDTYGDGESEQVESCGLMDGLSENGDDCDDANALYHEFTTWTLDGDGDGYGDNASAQEACAPPNPNLVTQGDDCDDDDENVNPGVTTDLCNRVDDDCDGTEDEDEPPTTWYRDEDDDGYGVDDGTDIRACGPSGSNTASKKEDCDDDNIDVFPGAPEDCDGEIDHDCDGKTDLDDPDAVKQTFYHDDDGDGYADMAVAVEACEAPEEFLDPTLDDCNDDDENVNPGVKKDFCNGVDDNCTGGVDEDEPPETWYDDDDDDGFGSSDPNDAIEACDEPNGFTDNNLDCDDGDENVHPDADEVCNGGIDDDCDAGTDEEVVDADTWYKDEDGDGFGGDSDKKKCEQPANHVANSDDCYDDPVDGAEASPANTQEVTLENPGRCDDALDNDCDQFADDLDPDCDDKDNDDFPDAIDAIFPYDEDGDADADYLCVYPDRLIFGPTFAPWADTDARTVTRDDPDPIFEPDTVPEPRDPDPIVLGDVYEDAWCAPVGDDLRFLSAKSIDDIENDVDLDDCNDWVMIELAVYCDDSLGYTDGACVAAGATDTTGNSCYPDSDDHYWLEAQ